MWLTVSGFMVVGLVSGQSLANHSNLESFLVAHASLSQDGCWREGFWDVERHSVSPFDLSRTLQVGGVLLVPYSLSGSPVIKQLMQMVTMVPGQGGRFQCAYPNKTGCNLKAFMQLETNPVTQLQKQGANSKNKTITIIVTWRLGKKWSFLQHGKIHKAQNI